MPKLRKAKALTKHRVACANAARQHNDQRKQETASRDVPRVLAIMCRVVNEWDTRSLHICTIELIGASLPLGTLLLRVACVSQLRIYCLWPFHMSDASTLGAIAFLPLHVHI